MAEYNRTARGFAKSYNHQGAASDPDSYINTFVKTAAGFANTDRQVEAAGAGNTPVGVVANAAVDHTVDVVESGEAYLKVNGNSTNISAGDPITTGASGVGVKNETAGSEYFAVALEDATADGVIIRVNVERGHIAAA